MKPRNKILLGCGGLLATALVALAITLSYDSPCPAATPLAEGTESMRAVTARCYGSPSQLRVEQIAKPKPNDDQVLVRVRAAGINPAEWHSVTGSPYIMRLGTGIGAPEHYRVGYDYAGIVESVGAKVTRFKPGDEVFGAAGGALAEYVVVRETGNILPKPPQMSLEEAAAIPIAAITALQGLRDHGHIAAGQKVLINGASGGVGTYAVQIAKAFGADVTGVCSTRNVEMVRALGADRVIDYTQEDVTEGNGQYDLVLDNVGNHSLLALTGIMKPSGALVVVGGSKSDPFLGPVTRVINAMVVDRFVDQKLGFFIADITPTDLAFLADLVRQGKMKTVIDRRYPLEETGAALEYLGSQRARGKVVVTID